MIDTLDQGSIGKRPILPIKERWNLLAIGVGLSLVSVVLQILDVIKINGLLSRVKEGDYGAAMEFARMQREGITPMKALLFLIVVASVVFICMWFYRAAQNVHQAGMNFLKYSPGWNVGWFFIPVVHIIMPAIVIRETVKASQSIHQPDEYSSWANNKPMPMFLLWSICFSVRVFVVYATVFYGMSFVRDIAEGNANALIQLYQGTLYISYFSVAIGLVELVALFLFSKKVTDLQEQYRKED
jgi:hypothetical protein